MVKKMDDFWICEECKLKYNEKKLAERCEAWCKKYGSCNLEITKYAVKDQW
jgi:hypothetical protein